MFLVFCFPSSACRFEKHDCLEQPMAKDDSLSSSEFALYYHISFPLRLFFWLKLWSGSSCKHALWLWGGLWDLYCWLFFWLNLWNDSSCKHALWLWGGLWDLYCWLFFWLNLWNDSSCKHALWLWGGLWDLYCWIFDLFCSED